MKDLPEIIQDIDRLKQSIEAMGKLPDDVLRKVDYKFRLECNYHSNRIEGGTLTMQETRSIMVGNITVEGKPLKEIREMSGHDLQMQEVMKVGRGALRLSEKRIRDMHKAIIVAEKPEDEAEIGVWKTVNNHIYNYRGERFDFLDHAEVPEAVHQLLNELNSRIDAIKFQKKDATHPLILAFDFHLKFLTIHPFTDGNGRIARLLSNLILVSQGYPPFWVSEGAEKEQYNRYLSDIQGYGGAPDLLYQFLSGLVLRSMRLVMDAIEGKDIEDIDEWRKKLRLLKGALPTEETIRLKKSPEVLNAVFEESVLPVVVLLMDRLKEFDDLFYETVIHFYVEENGVVILNPEQIQRHFISKNGAFNKASIQYMLKGFKKPKDLPFDLWCEIIWKFDDDSYSLYINRDVKQPAYHRYYHEPFEQKMIEDVVKKCASFMVDNLEEKLIANI